MVFKRPYSGVQTDVLPRSANHRIRPFSWRQEYGRFGVRVTFRVAFRVTTCASSQNEKDTLGLHLGLQNREKINGFGGGYGFQECQNKPKREDRHPLITIEKHRKKPLRTPSERYFASFWILKKCARCFFERKYLTLQKHLKTESTTHLLSWKGNKTPPPKKVNAQHFPRCRAFSR